MMEVKKIGGNSFFTNGTFIGISTEKSEDWELYEKVRMMMVGCGFSFHQDPRIKKDYRLIAKYHHHGSLKMQVVYPANSGLMVKTDLEFKSEIFPAGMRFEFYQNLIFENRSGGCYDFDKLFKMPYLMRLKFFAIRKKIISLLSELGFEDKTETKGKTSLESVFIKRESLERFQGRGFYKKDLPDYNCLDKDKNRLQDGDVRYFRWHNGRIYRGTIYHNINNMWWVVVNKDWYTNIASFDLFSDLCFQSLARDKKRIRRQRLDEVLSCYVKNSNFEKAIVIRDLIKKEETT